MKDRGFNCIELKKKGSKTRKNKYLVRKKVGFLYAEEINLLLALETLTSKNYNVFEDSVSAVKLMLTCLLK